MIEKTEKDHDGTLRWYYSVLTQKAGNVLFVFQVSYPFLLIRVSPFMVMMISLLD